MKRDTVLIVDDQEVNRYLLVQTFKDEYRILEAEDGQKALDILEEEKDRIGVILLDIVMPKVDGFEVLGVLNEKDYIKYIPVIMITGDSSQAVEEKGFNYGVSDYIRKPFNISVVRKRVCNIIELYEHKNQLEELVKIQTDKIEAQANKMKETNNQILDMLSSVVEFRNLESGEHIKRIKGFSKILADRVSEYNKEYELTPDKIEKITAASSMHDVGKIAIPDNILLKPGRLTPDEFEIMKTHTVKGCGILDSISFIDDKEFFEYCYEICRFHHEKFDGHGYPDGLKGDDIPIAAQIVSIADVYDALVSERVYKGKYEPDEAYNMILRGECGMFNPKIIECFKSVRPQFESFSDAGRA